MSAAGFASSGWWWRWRPLARALRPHRPGSDGHAAAAQCGAIWLGTDNFGRDVLSRIIWGTRLDLQMGVFGVFFPFVIGTTIGVASGYLGGIVDALLMRLLDVTISFPFFVLIIAIVAVLGPGLMQLLYRPRAGRLGLLCPARALAGHRAEAADFVMAARSLGFSRAADRLPPYPAQCDHAGHRLLDVGCGARYRARLLPQLSRPRHPAADRRNGA